MGYNDRSLSELARKLTPVDVPLLLLLVEDRNQNELRVGAQFGIASQCSASLAPTRSAALDHKIDLISAEDILSLTASFAGCLPEVRSRASAISKELREAFQVESARGEQG